MNLLICSMWNLQYLVSMLALLFGFPISDIDECAENTNNCHQNATCMNTQGSFTCDCNPGFSGDGVDCMDIDECLLGEDNCDIEQRANCINLVGSYDCECRRGYEGNGSTCVGKLYQLATNSFIHI